MMQSQLRIAAGPTQKEVGLALEYDEKNAQSYVAFWETGKRPVPKKKMLQLSELLKIPLVDLL